MSLTTLLFSKLQGLFYDNYKILNFKFVFEYLTETKRFLIETWNNNYEYLITVDTGGGGGGDQVPSAGLHVGGWVIFSPKNTVSTWY